ncbi:hypothetical protein LG047_15625 [Methylocystis sp. WRRC1]|uniref:hypothetical protein n=1 Tax=Methylocystis sp. WRRC1 TaxID=1732014 RepID=UPI001D1593E1|nr:hypothetical protein [Methylocystis sp. WRRC1]MCC3246730.1 hypothetical protein [Methylocystis sp. WRRC1]
MTELPLLSPLHHRGSPGRKRMREYIFRELQSGRDFSDVVAELIAHGHTYHHAYDIVQHQRQKIRCGLINSRRDFSPGPRDGGMIEFAPGHMADVASMRLIEKARGMR